MDEETDKACMALADDINEYLQGMDFNVVMNTLVYILASGGVNSGMSKQKFLAVVFEQLGEIYEQLKESDDGDSKVQ